MTPTRGVWFERPGEAAVRSGALADPGPGQALVRGLCSGISAGTERLVLRGEVPDEARAEMALPAMRGSFTFPISYGYAAVGVIEAAGAGVDPARVGERVLALHPHHDAFLIDAAELRALPRAPSPERATLAPSLETAVNVVWDAEVGLGDRVVVTGLGVIGLLIAHLARRAGAPAVTGIDGEPARRGLALALGATEAAGSVEEAADAIGAADVLVEASGSPAALAGLVARAGREARVVVASWYGAASVALPLGAAFHPRRVTLRSSQVGAIDPRRRGRWDHARRWRLVGELLGTADLDRLLAPAAPLSEVKALYAELASGVRWHPPQRVIDLRR